MIRALLIFIVASSLPNFSPLLSAQGFECSRPWPIIASPSLLASRPRSPATTLLITENMKTESVYCLHSITRFFADKHFRFLLEELGGRGVGGGQGIFCEWKACFDGLVMHFSQTGSQIDWNIVQANIVELI